MDWWERAACKERLELMFEKSVSTVRIEQNMLCSGCPVMRQCELDRRKYETSGDQVFGFRAGRSEAERKREVQAEWRRRMGKVAA